VVVGQPAGHGIYTNVEAWNVSEIVRPAKSQLVWRMRELLELRLKTEIPNNDLARVNQVVVSKYTGELNGIILSVHSDHPLGFDMARNNAPAEGLPRTLQDRGWSLPAETIGGSRFENWVGTVQVRMLKQVEPSTAVEIVDTIVSRVARVINNEPIIPITDEYGVHVFYLGTGSNYGYASGGGTTATDSHWCDWIAKACYTRTR
jgi:hypothetical protein